MNIYLLEVRKYGDRHENIKRGITSLNIHSLKEITELDHTIEYDTSDIVIAHDTDVRSHFRDLPVKLANRNSTSRTLLVLHTMDWDEGGTGKPDKQIEDNRALKIVRCGSDKVQRNIVKFLKAHESTASDEWQIDVLLGFDSKRDASIKLLEMFLPLDIELQLGDQDRCREEAELLIKKEDAEGSVTTLLQRIYTMNIAQIPQSSNSNSEISVRLKDRLISLARTVVTEKAPPLEVLFGYQVDGNGSVNKHDASKLRDEGFHKTFESLRNSLLNGQD